MWFQNSVRGAAGLAIAVFIAQRAGLQHGFWVVLGTLSVLRSNALGTGWSILSALAGTAVGILFGALLVIAIGTHETVLWVVLPFAILLAAYAPRAISFAAGQAGFTVVLFVLFNIIQPVGWSVGLVRVEDIAIGFAISLGVGLLFWPRGAGALLRNDLATAYARTRITSSPPRDMSGEGRRDRPRRAGRGRRLHRLDDAFRQYLAERSATETTSRTSQRSSPVHHVSAGPRSRSPRSADGGRQHAPRALRREPRPRDARAPFVVRRARLCHREPPGSAAAHPRRRGPSRLVECVRDAARSRDKAAVHGALVLLWTSQHLDNLWRLEAHLGERASAARAAASAAE